MEIHFTTKHVRQEHMLASYMTAVQISRLLMLQVCFCQPQLYNYLECCLGCWHVGLPALAQK